MAFWMLTGQSIRIGNFSVLPHALVRRLVDASELWIHYSSSILKLKLPYTSVTVDRGTRYFGKSQMNFISLIIHGLQAISIHKEIAAVRLILFSFVAVGAIVFCILMVIGIRMFTDLAIPGWASYLVAIFTVILIQVIGLGLLFIFLILGNRSVFEFIPARDYLHFIDPSIKVHP